VLTMCLCLAAAPAACGGSSAGTTTGPAGAGGAQTGSGGGGGGGTGGGAGGGGTTATGGATGAGGAPPASSEYWISPNGSDTNPGTMAQPFKTIGRGVNVSKPGVTLWVMPGTYPMTATVRLTQAAGPAAPINIFATSDGRPLLDFTGQPRGDANRGFEISGYGYHLRGLEIANAGDNGILISGSNNTVEDVILHGNEDTGLQITVPESSATNDSLGANNLILNCDSYANLDTATNGENADGFDAKLRIGAGNVFRGCRAWNNADDGYDLFAANDVVTIDHCWAFLNGKGVQGNDSAGDGNGFKLGGAPNGTGQGGAVHIVTGDSSFDNRTCGYTRNNNPDIPSLSNCYVHGNRDDFCNLSCSGTTTISTTGDMAKTIARNADGSLPTLK